jgi:hypothetical protein
MPDNQLTNIFSAIQRDYFNKKYKKIEVDFYKFRSLKHTIEWTPWRIRIRVNEHFRQAPEKILKLLAIILLAKVYKIRVGRDIRTSYNDYVEILKESLPIKKHNRLDAYTSEGEVFDLVNIFNQLNVLYFENKLRMPILGWSRKNSYWRLGFFDKERNLLVISRVFDQPGVPKEIVRYLVYHEMLHIHFPSERNNGRRVIHPPVFRKTEKQFPGYQDIQNWLKANLRKLKKN